MTTQIDSAAAAALAADTRVPVTVLTGFLGSGKTTLLNRILTENHGQRIAVIENEFGEIGIDNQIVINAEEEIFEMNNGCICCTVRGDLIRILGSLLKRKDRFDRILIETTGLADPSPVAQTFMTDEDLKEQVRLDGIVTVVDAKHVLQHLGAGEGHEAREQIAFADVILLNKIDLVTATELAKVESRVRDINGVAKIHRTQQAAIDLDVALNIGGFDLGRALTVNPLFLEPEYPFSRGVAFELSEGRSLLTIHSHAGHEHEGADHGHDGADHGHAHEEAHHHSRGSRHRHEEAHAHKHAEDHHGHGHDDHGHGHGHDHEHDHGHGHGDALKLVLLAAPAAGVKGIETILREATMAFSAKNPPVLHHGETISPGQLVEVHCHGEGDHAFELAVPRKGSYVLFAEHGHTAFHLHVSHGHHAVEPTGDRPFRLVHSHEDDVTSVGLRFTGDLNPKRFDEWLSKILSEKGGDIFRMKGIVALKGERERFVFQGVHMLFDGQPGKPWAAGEARDNQLVFIGRNLDRDDLTKGIKKCLA
jgi:G3E family GTPase